MVMLYSPKSNPLAMSMYALVTISFIKKLEGTTNKCGMQTMLQRLGKLFTGVTGGTGYLPMTLVLVIFQIVQIPGLSQKGTPCLSCFLVHQHGGECDI